MLQLLDADICVDLARGYPPALQWFASLTQRPALPGLVVMELLAGCHNSREMRATRKFARQFQLYWSSQQDCERAIETYARAKLSHGLSVNDALIAETAIGLGATLCTFNVKHFRAVAGLNHRQPYPKP